MISRRTTLSLAKLYDEEFTISKITSDHGRISRPKEPDRKRLYDFLFEREYDTWLCNLTKKLAGSRGITEFVLKLHTGETQSQVTQNWSRDQSNQLGQEILHKLAEDILKYSDDPLIAQWDRPTSTLIDNLRRALELDGYIYREGRLLFPETDVFDVQEEQGVLSALYYALGLGRRDLVLHHLKLSDEHYHASRWDDSISNSRKFLECVLQEVAATHSLRFNHVALTDRVLHWPKEVRSYLQKAGLIDSKEVVALAEVYSLLSHTGGHPYMAQNDQARLLRHLALTFSQFAMLRLEGAIKKLS